MTALALAVYGLLIAATAVVVFRRPIVALYVFVARLAAAQHRHVAALRRAASAAMRWTRSRRGRRSCWRRRWRRWLSPPSERGACRSGRSSSTGWRSRTRPWSCSTRSSRRARSTATPVRRRSRTAFATTSCWSAAYFLGRSLPLDVPRVRWLIAGAAAAVAAWGLIEVYSVPIEWWRHSGAVGYFHRELGYDYHGPGGLPENFAFNTSDGLFRRLVSTFVSPLATAYLLVVALLLLATFRRVRPLAVALAVVCGAGLLWTFSRSSIVALAIGLLVARRGAAAAGGRRSPVSPSSPSASASRRSSTTSRPERTGSRATFRTSRRRRRRKGPCRRAAACPER